MNEQRISLNFNEASIYSGACLTYSGVPFHRIEKTRTSPQDLGCLNELFNGFVHSKHELRRAFSGGSNGVAIATSPATTVELALSDEELELLIEVFEAVLEEHQPPGEHSDYDLELHVGPREAVEAALEKLRGVRQEQTNNS